MNCPLCRVELRVADRQGVEIDYCPQCRGVWLDRGELDKIIDRANEYDGRDRQERDRQGRDLEERDRDDDDDRSRREYRGPAQTSQPTYIPAPPPHQSHPAPPYPTQPSHPSQPYPPQPYPPQPPRYGGQDYDERRRSDHRRDDDDRDDDDRRYKRKRGGFLGELFDFD